MGQVFDDELGAVVADAVDDFDIGDGGGAQLWQGREVRGHGFDGVPRQVGDQGEGAHAARHDFAVEVGDLVHVQAEDVRDGGQVDDSFGAEGGEFGFDAGDVGGVADVVAHDEGAFGGGSAYEVFDLEGEEASLGSQFFEVFGDFGGDAADHFHALHDGGDVAHCGAVAHFEDREGLEDFVESLTVAVEGVHGQVGAREQGFGFFDEAVLGAHVDGDHAHGGGQGQDGQVCLAGGALGGAVAHAGFVGGDGGVGEELDVGFADAP